MIRVASRIAKIIPQRAVAVTFTAPLPAMVRDAARKLARAETAAEVLEAREAATFAYDQAKIAGRLARAKRAHDEVLSAVYHAQADALEIEATAKRRLADEYDAAQERGDVAGHGGKRGKISDENLATVGNIPGLTSEQIHDARTIRDAERKDPGIVRRTLNGIVERGEEPTRAAVKREISGNAAPPTYTVDDDALWLWGRLKDFERLDYLDADPSELLAGMTPPMRKDVLRLAPLVAQFLLGFRKDGSS